MINKRVLLVIFLASFSSNIVAQGQEDDLKLGRLKALCADPDCPLKFDKKTNTYSLTFQKIENGKSVIYSYPLYFCLFSGVPLEPGKNAFFAEDLTLLKKITSELGDTKDLQKVKAILGKPDFEYGENPFFQWEIVYTSKSQTTNIMIQKDAQSGVAHVYATAKTKS